MKNISKTYKVRLFFAKNIYLYSLGPAVKMGTDPWNNYINENKDVLVEYVTSLQF